MPAYESLIDVYESTSQFDNALELLVHMISFGAKFDLEKFKYVADMCIQKNEIECAQNILIKGCTSEISDVAFIRSYLAFLADYFPDDIKKHCQALYFLVTRMQQINEIDADEVHDIFITLYENVIL